MGGAGPLSTETRTQTAEWWWISIDLHFHYQPGRQIVQEYLRQEWAALVMLLSKFCRTSSFTSPLVQERELCVKMENTTRDRHSHCPFTATLQAMWWVLNFLSNACMIHSNKDFRNCQGKKKMAPFRNKRRRAIRLLLAVKPVPLTRDKKVWPTNSTHLPWLMRVILLAPCSSI